MVTFMTSQGVSTASPFGSTRLIPMPRRLHSPDPSLRVVRAADKAHDIAATTKLLKATKSLPTPKVTAPKLKNIVDDLWSDFATQVSTSRLIRVFFAS